MLPTPADDQNEPDRDADQKADAMKDQLRKDVASWSAARSADPPNLAGRTGAPAGKSAASPSTRAPRQKAKPAEASPIVAEKKPFKMSYDGTTDRDYIAHRIKYGAR